MSQNGIAVIGMSANFPGAPSVSKYWENLLQGRCHISRFDREELLAAGISDDCFSESYIPVKAVIERANYFAPDLFGMSPMEARITDPQDRLLLQASWDLIHQSCHHSDSNEFRTGVFLAKSALNDYFYKHLLTHPQLLNQFGEYQLHLHCAPDYLSTRISYKLNLKGPSITVQSACSSSLSAVVAACQNLLDGQCDQAIAGAASLTFPYKQGYPYHDGSIMSKSGLCSPFSSKADGTVPGDGVGAVLLKREEDAVADGDPIIAVIRGYGINNDGSQKAGYAAPSVQGQCQAITDSLEMAAFSPDTVGFIETHGTGTAIGDPIEVEGLKASYENDQSNSTCYLGAVKGNIGHLGAASGIASLIKTCLVLSERKIPPVLRVQDLSPHIKLNGSSFKFNQGLIEWDSNSGLRRAGVSSFGLGGTNIHLSLEESACISNKPQDSSRYYSLPLSAKSEEDLKRSQSELIQYIKSFPNKPIQDISHTLKTRKEFPYKSVLTKSSSSNLVVLDKKFTQSKIGLNRLVFMFPGQGSQYAGMGSELLRSYPLFKKVLGSCHQQFRDQFKLNLEDTLTSDVDWLKRTDYVQAALFSVEYALAQLLESWGLTAHASIGHSLGELSAAATSGMISLEEAIYLVGHRGRLMQACPNGAMVACFVNEEKLRPMLNPQVTIAAFNSPMQTVVSGSAQGISNFERELESSQIRFKRLNSQKPFHSFYMQETADLFASEHLSQVSFKQGKTPIYSNLDGRLISYTDANYWKLQMIQPVHFLDGMRNVSSCKDSLLVEVGPGRTLTSLLGLGHVDSEDISPSIALMTSNSRKQEEAKALLDGIGEMWTRGWNVDWSLVQDEGKRIFLSGYQIEGEDYYIPPASQSLTPIVKEKPREEAASQSTTDQILAIWKKYLGYNDICLNANFYDLGGDSVTAISLVHEMNTKLKTKLYPHDLITCPTIHDLAEKVEGRKENTQNFCLVKMQEGDSTNSPLFLFHAIGGGVQYFRDLVEQLPSDLPVYAIQSQALDGRSDPGHDVHEMADEYLRIILDVQNAGCYRLLGHSFGGLLAYEVACRLRQGHYEVDLLAMVDTPGFEHMPQRLYSDASILSSMSILFANDQDESGLVSVQELSGLDVKDQAKIFLSKVKNPYARKMSESDLLLLLQIYKQHSHAMFGYQASESPDGLHLQFFKAKQRDQITADDPEIGWLKHMGDQCCDLQYVAGSHHTMMERPHVCDLAARLEVLIN